MAGDAYRNMLPDSMFTPDGKVKQPDWYLLSVAAKWLNMSAPELNNMEEPERTYWFNRGLTGHNAEAAVERAAMPVDATKMGLSPPA